MKIPRFIKMHIQKCPACGEMTLEVVERGDICTNCGYNVYYP